MAYGQYSGTTRYRTDYRPGDVQRGAYLVEDPETGERREATEEERTIKQEDLSFNQPTYSYWKGLKDFGIDTLRGPVAAYTMGALAGPPGAGSAASQAGSSISRNTPNAVFGNMSGASTPGVNPMAGVSFGGGGGFAPSLGGAGFGASSAGGAGGALAGGGGGGGLMGLVKHLANNSRPSWQETAVGIGTGALQNYLGAREANKDRDYQRQQDEQALGQRQGELAMQYHQQGDPFAQQKNRIRMALLEALMGGYQAPAYDSDANQWTGGIMGVNQDIFSTIMPFLSEQARLGSERGFEGLAQQSAPGYSMGNAEQLGYNNDSRSALARLLLSRRGQ